MCHCSPEHGTFIILNFYTKSMQYDFENGHFIFRLSLFVIMVSPIVTFF